MKNKLLAILLITTSLVITTFAQSGPDERAVKARQTVTKTGTGPKAKVNVKLRDSTKLKGYIGSVTEDSFSIVDEKSGTARDIKFSDVEKVDRRGGSNKGTIITLAVLGGVAAIILGIVGRRCANEGGC